MSAEVKSEGWKERLKAEYADLSERIDKLSEFLTEQEQTQTIDQVTHALLIAQHGAMTAYQSILWIRLSTSVSIKEG